MAELKTYSDIYTAITEELKVPTTDTATLNRIKRDVNIVYQEVCAHQRWFWLQKSVALQVAPYYNGGTASVTTGSTTVTLSASIPVGAGSKKYFYFAIEGYSEIYKITAHTAGSDTLTIDAPYTGTTNSAVGFKIWNPIINLPTDCREVIEVTHDFMREPLTAVGKQKMREIQIAQGRTESRPVFYYIDDFFDPTTGTDETESDRYRQMIVQPAIYNQTTTLRVDYTQEILPMSDDDDEPAMPIEDRSVLLYKGLARAWARERNPEESARNETMGNNVLARMMGKLQGGQDKPVLKPDRIYVAAKRANNRRNVSSPFLPASNTGGGAQNINFLQDVIIDGATIIDTVQVNNGVTIDGRDISEDGADLDAHIAASQDVHGIGTGNAVVGTGTTQTLTNKNIATTSNQITGTINTIAEFNGSGNLQSSDITTSELDYLDDVVALSTVALADNQAAAANVLTWAHASYDVIQIDYSVKRGTSNRENGRLYITHDGTNASIAQELTSIGTIGVTFSVDINGTDLRLRYTSTSTGTAPSFKYKLQKWAS